jgi:hypothetical protein
MSVDVIVPIGEFDEHRKRAWGWVSARWDEVHPNYNVILGETHASPWCKARAIRKALKGSTADILVIADADVWVENVERYVEMIDEGYVNWACPHRRVFRFNERGTDMIVEDGLAPVDVALHRGVLAQTPYTRMLGGGLVVLRRDLYDACPIDPRFEGWGGEDGAWGFALVTVGGKRKQGEELLWHLWHEPAERLDRKIGTMENHALCERYRLAADNVEATQALIEEGQQAWRSKTSS